MQRLARCPKCGERTRDVGPAYVVTGKKNARLCSRCWWTANAEQLRALRGAGFQQQTKEAV